MVVFQLVFGIGALGIYLDDFASPAAKPTLLELHTTLGILIRILMIIRTLARNKTPRPAPVLAGNAFALLDTTGHLTHLGLYVFAILTTVIGIITSMQGNLLARMSTRDRAGSHDQIAPRNFQ